MAGTAPAGWARPGAAMRGPPLGAGAHDAHGGEAEGGTGTPWADGAAGAAGYAARGGGRGGAVIPCVPIKYRRMPWTAVARSRMAVESSCCERRGAASATAARGAASPVEGGDRGAATVEAGGVSEVAAVVAVGRPDDMIETEVSDTKLVEPTSLPGLGRRL
ncbi:uncharacterized protein [Lolium perenne]|uniref:uncharacterized protein isoform X1 n=1 Tax=Lolium perenne TaxID=4522 RepID=UPI003A99C91F